MPNDAEGEEAIRKLNGLILADRQVLVARMHETLPGEMEFREWLRDNADEVLNKVGVREGQTLVDYGCGPGIFSIAAAKIVGRQGKVYAMDIRPRALTRLKEIAMEDGLPNLKTMLIDKSTVSVALSDGIADVVLLYDVLQEIQDKPRLMAELYRILKPSGVLSVFPMHLGTGKLLDLVDAVGLFQLRDRYGVSGFESASEIVNLTKRRP
jgi:SAM-dependent methyltransferase